jgi:hypothetical protein
MQWASWLNSAIGVWLVASPWVIGYDDWTVTRNSMLFGFLILALALVSALQPPRVHALAWTNALFGGWLMIAPWMIGLGASLAMWNSVAAGTAVMVLAWARASARVRT